MTAPADAARFLADEATAALVRVRQAWPWLSEARVPGTAGAHARVHRYRSPQQHQAEAYHVRRDRAAAFQAVRAGRVPSGPKPAPARVDVLSLRASVADDLRRLADRLTQGVLGTRDMRVALIGACPWCQGQDVAVASGGFDRLVVCSRCEGRGYACTCRSVSCSCDRTDAVVHVALAVTAEALPLLADPDRAADTCRVLERSDRAIRRHLGLAEDYRRLPVPCPACGYRELCAEVSSSDRQEWSVFCGSTSCSCKGPACGCGRPVRYRGRRHRWPWREFPLLVQRLGVDLPELRGLRQVS